MDQAVKAEVKNEYKLHDARGEQCHLNLSGSSILIMELIFAFYFSFYCLIPLGGLLIYLCVF